MAKPASQENIEYRERLKATRIARGYPSQAALARALGIEENKYNHWEKTGKRPQTISLFRLLCQTLGVTSDYLLFGETRGLTREAYAALMVNHEPDNKGS